MLILGDTTEINFGRLRQAEGLMPVGNGSGRGFLLHNALAVDAETWEIIGLATFRSHSRRAFCPS